MPTNPDWTSQMSSPEIERTSGLLSKKKNCVSFQLQIYVIRNKQAFLTRTSTSISEQCIAVATKPLKSHDSKTSYCNIARMVGQIEEN